MASVQKIAVDTLLEAINRDNRLPWQCPFIQPAINWSYMREYSGLNRYLLRGGEYITMYALKKMNEEKGTNFMVKKGSKSHLVTYYKRKLVDVEKATESQRNRLTKSTESDGKDYLIEYILLYTRVFEIGAIQDVKTGDVLPRKLGSDVKEYFSDVETEIAAYLERTGIRVVHEGGGAHVTGVDGNRLNMPAREYFPNIEAYYRVLFHELIHTTGTAERLNRNSFKNYHIDHKDGRGMEELIAETGSLLLATEFGFREDYVAADNSLSYIQGWASWMKENPYKVVSGFQQAERAVDYILGRDKGVDLGLREIES